VNFDLIFIDQSRAYKTDPVFHLHMHSGIS
jgi:hypothetical protein